MPINFLSPGMEGCVKRIAGRDDTRRFLESLGLVPGGRVTMVSSMGDNVILGIRGTRIAISRKLADRIHI
ncbi:MAG TPA: FeoA family protein [Synergistaceae bacterium]|jgi:ferrous iron transport protein A|nr:ferrous iron transport protein A [Synergistaceae bacterium]MCK9341901.1 ferrous iron transport protein A [Synergistaceae bacterium]MDD3673575.1 FeoA family protein [Synergistaceae bacterium]NLW62419.1 ferrous iron transport protein A [Synergistaceae bacterium]HQA55302.1 FeoA family protein [Synergistaceae bacterium]